MSNGWSDYDPSWLVALARAQRPELVEPLSRCTRAFVESDAYTYFVPGHAPNIPGSEWQFERNVVLEDPELGTLVLDVLKDGRIGGVEIVEKI